MSKVVDHKNTSNLTINDMFKQIQILTKSYNDKVFLLKQLIKAGNCDNETFTELSKEINEDIDKIYIFETEIIARNNQTVVFQEKDYKIISLLKLKQSIIMKKDFSEGLVSTISMQDNSPFITNSLSEFKKARENQVLIDNINKLITQFNNTIQE